MFLRPSYTPDQIEEWIGLLASDLYLEAIGALEFVVAEVDGRMEGFCILNLQTDELQAIYLSPEAAGRGFGRELMRWGGARRPRAGLD